jgi:hypothetical protein
LIKRQTESERAAKAAKEAEARRALGRQILEDAERLVATRNKRQKAICPMLFSTTIGAALAARRCFACVRYRHCYRFAYKVTARAIGVRVSKSCVAKFSHYFYSNRLSRLVDVTLLALFGLGAIRRSGPQSAAKRT